MIENMVVKMPNATIPRLLSNSFIALILMISSQVLKTSAYSFFSLFENPDLDELYGVDLFGSQKVTNVLPAAALDRAQYVRWNLDDGMAIRFMDNAYSWEDRLKSLGFDISSGFGFVKLSDYGMASCISAWTWWTYDTKLGYFELFDGTGYLGEKWTFYLSDFDPDKLVDVLPLRVENRASSLRFDQICQVCTVLFYEHTGTGIQLEAFAWDAKHEIPNLSDVSMNDRISSFIWKLKEPLAVEFGKVELTYNSVEGGKTYPKFAYGRNEFSTPTTETLKISEAKARSYALTTALSVSLGLKVTGSMKFIIKDTFESSLTVEFSATYTQTTTRTTSETGSLGLELTTTILAPPRTKWNSTFIATTGKTSGEGAVDASFFYDAPVNGSVFDPSKNLYKFTIPMTWTIDGDINYRTQTFSYVEEYLDKPTARPSKKPTLNPTTKPTSAPVNAPTSKPTEFKLKKCKKSTICLNGLGNFHKRVDPITQVCKTKCVKKASQLASQKKGWTCGKCT